MEPTCIMVMGTSTEYIVQCDSTGKIIGPIGKREAHDGKNRVELTHFSTWSMVFNPKIGKYLLQRKNPKKHDKISAGKWDMGVAGHNNYTQIKGKLVPMDFEETLRKEAAEEIGLDLKMFKFKDEFLIATKKMNGKAIGYIFDRFHYQTKTDNEYVGLGFILMPTTETNFQDGEVVEVKWLASTELEKFLKENDNYCHPLSIVFKKVEEFRKQNRI